MKVYIIDDRIGKAYKVIQSLKTFYSQEKKDELLCELFLINFDQNEQDNETVSYYNEHYNNLKTQYSIYFNEEDIIKKLQKINEPCIFLIDLNLVKNEISKIKENTDYKCLSMKLYDILRKKNCCFYSDYVDDEYKPEWEKRFKKLYNTSDLPEIIERTTLLSNYFDIQIGKKILEI